MKVRDRECLQCGHKWTAAVRYSAATTNLSGEATCYCPKCNSRGTKGSPIREVKENDHGQEGS